MRLLILSDGLRLTTGFGTVTRHVAAELVRRGHDVAQLAAHDVPPFGDSRPYYELGVKPYFPSGNDSLGRDVIEYVLADWKPECVLFIVDPGSCWDWRGGPLGVFLRDVPWCLYAPVEGAPIADEYLEPFKAATRAMTLTRWSADELLREDGPALPWVYHGVDPDVFQPLDRAERRRVRQALGWEGQFVVSYVARNAGRKRQDALIQAMRVLKEVGEENILLYLHCRPWEGYTLGGWNLIRVAEWCGVAPYVQFATMQRSEFGEGVDSLALKLGASDLYVHASGVEGFGIPIAEAMSTALPTVVVDDGGNMAEVAGETAYARIRPYAYSTHFSGSQLALAHPAHFAEAIANAREDPERRAVRGQLARERAVQHFRWDTMACTVAAMCEQAYAAGPKPAEEAELVTA